MQVQVAFDFINPTSFDHGIHNLGRIHPTGQSGIGRDDIGYVPSVSFKNQTAPLSVVNALGPY